MNSNAQVMKSIILFIFLSISHFGILISQTGLELHHDGIILPNLLESQKPATTQPGFLIFNATKNRLENFTQNFQWEGIASSKFIDGDGDSELSFSEGITQTSNDILNFRLDNGLKLTLASNSNGIPRLYFNGGQNTFLGTGAGLEAKSTANENIAIGSSALANNRTADNNIGIGTRALFQANINDDAILYGDNNVAIGYEAGMTDAPNNSVFLGPFAGKNATNVNNALYISNAEGDEPLIYGEFGNKMLRVNGSLETNERSIFMRNLGGTDSNHGIKWGESSENAVFGITYDGTGSGTQNQLKIREYIGAQSDIMTIRADGKVKLDKLIGPSPGPVFAEADGSLSRNSGLLWTMISPYEIDPFHYSREICINHLSGPPTGCPKSVFIPIKIPQGSILKKVKIYYVDDENLSWLGVEVRSYDIMNQKSSILGEFKSNSGSTELRSHVIDIDDVLIDNENHHYDIDLYNFGLLGNSFVHGISIGYEYQ